ncbi:hypothetical protein Syun_022995 [Stephania yunnanensis]|uniref:Uncharacterized protein n=1 Tax=Stephania yunnanensis TaxID=152371 RepID=A0AAP0F8S0_9MAGN
MIYAFRLIREQSIMSSSFVEVTSHCPLLLCLVRDRPVRQRATALLLNAVHRAAADAAADSPLLVGVLVDRAAARCLPPQPCYLRVRRCCWPSAPSHHLPPPPLA